MAVRSTFADVQHRGAVLAPEGQAELELSRAGRVAIWCSILSFMFGSQIALNIGDFPASTDLFAYGIFSAYFLCTGFARIGLFGLVAFLVAAVFAFLKVRSTPDTSWTSLFLMVVLYVPFFFRFKRNLSLQSVQEYVQNVFVSVAVVISVIAFVQLLAVNVLKLSIFTNIAFVLPEQIKGAGAYQFGREEGGIVKGNGFFLREASTLSIVTATALLIEYFSFARKKILGLLLVGLLSSVSGSGIFLLFVGLLFPTSIRKVPRFVALALLAVSLLVIGAQISALQPWYKRFAEFQTEGTSGYARYVAPLEMVERSFSQGSVNVWVGSGGGTYLRTVKLLQRKYEINDPTWAKLLYEYGVIGLLAMSMVFATRLYSGALRPEVCNAIFFSWMSSAGVLKSEVAFLVWILTLVPALGRQHGQSDMLRQASDAADGVPRSVDKLGTPAPV
jgi:hypothetical protein